MTVQERLEDGKIYNRFDKTAWKEGGLDDELAMDYPFMAKYLHALNRYGVNTKIAILKSLKFEKTYHLYLYTREKEYSISVAPNYIGAGYNNRYFDPLEGWRRGGDLADGEATEETFVRVLMSMLATELIKYDDGWKPSVGIHEVTPVDDNETKD